MFTLCAKPLNSLLLLLLNACVRVADVMIFTFVSLMPVHNIIHSQQLISTTLYNTENV